MATRAEIRTTVIEKLNSFAEPGEPIPDNEEGEKIKLWEDLGLSGNARSALSVPFSKISRRFSGKPVAPSDAGDCKTVKDCVDLIMKKIPGSK